MINANFTLDSYIGNSNLKEYLNALSKNNSTCPVFIYGQTSSGKTHIAQAIYNRFNGIDSGMLSKYIPMQLFFNEFIEAVVNNNERQFIDSFKNLDLLIIDDIHLLEGKEKSQMCLANIFDILSLSNKQLVFTSLVGAKQLTSFSQHIKSRVLSGLVIELTIPNLESKIDILQAKSLDIGLDISDDLLKIICERTDLDIRVLQGILTTLHFNLNNKHKPTSSIIAKLLNQY